MDFTLNEEQQAVAELANRIMGDHLDMERHMEIEAEGEWFDRYLYADLASAGLVGIGLGEDVGGGGLDLIAVGQLLEAQGRHVAPVPLWSGKLAALAVDAFGSDEQRRRELPGCADGSNVLTLGLQEYLNDDITSPTARVVDSKMVGTKEVVEFAAHSSKIVVVAGLDDGTDNGTTSGTGLFLVDLSDEAVTTEVGVSTRLQPVHQVSFYGAPCEPLGPADGVSVKWLAQRAVALLCATQVGVVDRALRLAAEYTSEREQFGPSGGHLPGRHPAPGRPVHAHRSSAAVYLRRSVRPGPGQRRLRPAAHRQVVRLPLGTRRGPRNPACPRGHGG